MTKVVYIAGTVHSGTTLLGMCLASTAVAIHFGEVFNILDKKLERNLKQYCTTGVLAKDCDFWAPTLKKLDSLGENCSTQDKYHVFLTSVEEHFGSEVTIIDSSKDPKHIQTLVDVVGADNLTIIHLTKDVRSYAESMEQKRKRSINWKKTKMFFFGFGLEEHFIKWYKVNKRIEKAIELSGVKKTIILTYEFLCLRSHEVANLINSAHGELIIDLDKSPRRSRDYTITGNRMRENPKKLAAINYDFRWFESTRWIRPFLLFPKIRRYNESIYRKLSSGDIFKN
ncbi:MAG: hypothetical protein Q7U33_03935 [Methylotenera sp.]|uniref:hypothetical protein n=1 Tax=Methylotenera sp. TaxID=2051956 RepID=UPI002716711D|nr:hypothetical protein [Methylotenera sp.]MDO9150508.1 hypothetical protein [Methylotenera sp.]